MKRIDTATRSVAKFGTVNGVSRDGFTDGIPNTVATTTLSDRWFDAAQEEMCRVVELNGRTLQQSADPVTTPTSVQQLHDVIRSTGAEAFTSCDIAGTVQTGSWAVGTGLAWAQTVGLTGAIQPGAIYLDGVRIEKDAGRIVADLISPHTFTASRDTYIGINASGLLEFQAVVNNAAEPTPTAGYQHYYLIVTNGAGITDEISLFNAFPSIPAQQVMRTKSNAPHRGDFYYSGQKTFGLRDVTSGPWDFFVLSALEMPVGVCVNIRATIVGINRADQSLQDHRIIEYEFAADSGVFVDARAQHVIGTPVSGVGGTFTFAYDTGRLRFRVSGLGGGQYSYTVRFDYTLTTWDD